MSIGILPNVNSVKQNRAVKQWISVYSRTTMLTNNQKTKANTELPFSQRKRKRRQKCCRSQLGCVSKDSESVESQRGAESRGNPMQKQIETKSTSTIHTVHATSGKQVSGKIKDHRLAWNIAKNICNKEKDKATFY